MFGIQIPTVMEEDKLLKLVFFQYFLKKKREYQVSSQSTNCWYLLLFSTLVKILLSAKLCQISVTKVNKFVN